MTERIDSAPTRRAAAFFDLDRTLMAGSSGTSWVRASYEAGLIGRRRMFGWLVEGLRFRLRGSTDATTQQVMSQVSEVLAGASARELDRLGPKVLAGVLPRIYPQMLAEVHAHQDAGRPTFIVSASGNDLVEMLATVLGMDGGIGTAYEIGPDGRFTGEYDGPFMYGEGKLQGMDRFARDHEIELSRSWAYSDSVSDLPMLRGVGNAVAVNPDAELAAIARAEGWQIMRFEKLGRRLFALGATLVAGALGAGAVLARDRASARPVAASSRPRRR